MLSQPPQSHAYQVPSAHIAKPTHLPGNLIGEWGLGEEARGGSNKLLATNALKTQLLSLTLPWPIFVEPSPPPSEPLSGDQTATKFVSGTIEKKKKTT